MNDSSATLTKGEQTRLNILETAADIASVEGLDGLTIGRLSKEMTMSKSGLFGHFGSKQELQLATLAQARIRFEQAVIEPSRRYPRGYLRIWGLCQHWLAYMEEDVFPGGCFFLAVSAEFDDQPGAIHDQIAADMGLWRGYLTHQAQVARDNGHLRAEVDPQQLSFELFSFYIAANWARRLFKDVQAIEQARRAMRAKLLASATAEAPTLPD